jgi:hypothetical protein
MNGCVAPRPIRMRFGGALLYAVLAVAWLMPINPGPARAQAMHDVADPQGRFTMSVPTDWTVRTVPYHGENLLLAFGPAAADGIRSVLTVYVDPQVQSISSEAAAKSAEADLRRLPDYASVEEGPTTVDGLPAYHRYFTRTRAGRSLYQMQVYVARGLEVYIITCAILNDPGRIDRDASVMLKIIGTFRVTASHATPSDNLTASRK